jgi:methionyl-tRNA synthetase
MAYSIPTYIAVNCPKHGCSVSTSDCDHCEHCQEFAWDYDLTRVQAVICDYQPKEPER